MADLSGRFVGPFDEFVDFIDRQVMSRSSTVSREGGSTMSTINGTRVVVKAYERYAYLGGNRAGMTFTAVESGDHVLLYGVAMGGSQALFFKVNTFSEANFLNTLEESLRAWEVERGFADGVTNR